MCSPGSGTKVRGKVLTTATQVLRSTQTAHKLLQSFYEGQSRATKILRGSQASSSSSTSPSGGTVNEAEGKDKGAGAGAGAGNNVDAVTREQKLMKWYEDEMPSLRVRPSLLQPVAQTVGFTAGALSTLSSAAPFSLVPKLLNSRRNSSRNGGPNLGLDPTNPAQMGGTAGEVTRAVEDAFVEHLNDQLRDLHVLEQLGKGKEGQEEVEGLVKRLKQNLVETRDTNRRQTQTLRDTKEEEEEEGKYDEDHDDHAHGDGDVKDLASLLKMLTGQNAFGASIQVGYKTLVDRSKVL